MSDDTTTQAVLFADLFDRPLLARFDEPLSSSDGGAILLAAVDRRLGICERLAGCLTDERQPGKVLHPMVDLVRERVFMMACGYADANDAARLAEDPVHKLLLERDPVNGMALASQPTLSRFENAAGRAELLRMGEALADAVVDRHRKRLGGRARRITVDLDVTHDPTHGAQQLALFNDFHRCWCYLPLLGFVRFDDEPEQYLVAAMLRPGNAPTRSGVLGLLRRLLPKLRRSFPKARLRVRLDAGFPSPELLDFLEAEGVEYVIGLPKNSVLSRWSTSLLEGARAAAEASGRSERVYETFRYGARSWKRLRRIVGKLEVTAFSGRALRDNPRFVVTNLEEPSPQELYEDIYCQRGDVENRIKELKNDMALDRTSCTTFLANQLRVLLTAAAYALMQELRLAARRTAYARAQVMTLREHLLKIGVRLVASIRRLVLHLPASYPFQSAWLHLARAVGATPG